MTVILKCAYDKCKKPFTPKTHNQKYCSDECCRTATNIKIKQKYYADKERLNGKKRVCKNRGCNQLLSRYQEGEICSPCQAKEKERDRQHLLDIINGISS